MNSCTHKQPPSHAQTICLGFVNRFIMLDSMHKDVSSAE